MANNVTNEQIRVSLDVLTPSQSIVDLAVRFPIYVINEYQPVQSDWNQTTSTESNYILNKPTKLSDFTNDGNGGSPLNPFVTRNEFEATQAEWDYIMGN